MIEVNDSDVLFVTDMQNDFMPGGLLAVEDGDRIIPTINGLVPRFSLVVASQDWHPINHVSFKERGGPWPPHCVQKTEGAQLHPSLNQSRIALIVRKAYDPDIEQYSVFDAVSRLADMLKARGVKRIFVTGVATDYCVRYSSLGALEGGLEVVVLTDAVKGIDVEPGDSEDALKEVEERGGVLAVSTDLSFDRFAA
ncbi:MAG: nicotinamidase [Candidatus Aquicultorales bacterium]